MRRLFAARFAMLNDVAAMIACVCDAKALPRPSKRRRGSAAARGGRSRHLGALAVSVCLCFRAALAQTFEVDVTTYVPGRVRAAQPERSAAMKTGRLPKASMPSPDGAAKK